jgi:hypothetical protein
MREPPTFAEVSGGSESSSSWALTGALLSRLSVRMIL